MKDRDFKGIWIPKEIWVDSNLTFLEKGILMEIDSLDGGNGCYASNKYLAEFCQCSDRKVTDAISKLEKLGLIKTEYSTQRIIYSLVGYRKNCEGGSKKFEGGSKKFEGGRKNCDQVIIVQNNSSEEIVKDNPPVSPRFRKPTVEEVKAYCMTRRNGVNPQRFVDYYEANGWKVGRNPMKDWQAAVRTWERADKKSRPFQSFEELLSDYTRDS